MSAAALNAALLVAAHLYLLPRRRPSVVAGRRPAHPPGTPPPCCRLPQLLKYDFEDSKIGQHILVETFLKLLDMTEKANPARKRVTKRRPPPPPAAARSG